MYRQPLGFQPLASSLPMERCEEKRPMDVQATKRTRARCVGGETHMALQGTHWILLLLSYLHA